MKPNSKRWRAVQVKLPVYITSIVVMLLLAGGFTYQVTKAEITVLQDGEAVTVATHNDTVGELLEELNIEVATHDEQSHENSSLLTDGMEIHITKANQVVVNTDGEETAFYTTAESVGEFLKEENIEIKEHDTFSHAETDRIKDGLKLEIKRAYQVTLNDAGKKQRVWTTGGSVGSLLADQKITLGNLDDVTPSKEENLKKDTVITITRVKILTEILEEQQPYTTVTNEDHTLDKGVKQVLAKGEDGILAKHMEVRLENGKEVARTLLKEEVRKQAKQEVVAIGTKVKAPTPEPVTIAATSTTNPAGKSGAEGRTIYMHATAYTAECAGCSGKTATGINLKQNPHMKVIAVDPSVIPLGSKVWVEGYGTAIAGDTGGAIQGNQIDIHMPSREAALNFGSRQVQVKVLQ